MFFLWCIGFCFLISVLQFRNFVLRKAEKNKSSSVLFGGKAKRGRSEQKLQPSFSLSNPGHCCFYFFTWILGDEIGPDLCVKERKRRRIKKALAARTGSLCGPRALWEEEKKKQQQQKKREKEREEEGGIPVPRAGATSCPQPATEDKLCQVCCASGRRSFAPVSPPLALFFTALPVDLL